MTDINPPSAEDVGDHLLWRLRHNETAKHLCNLAADEIVRLSHDLERHVQIASDLASRPDTKRQAVVEKCARIAEADCTPAYGPDRAAMEDLADRQRRSIADRIRSLSAPRVEEEPTGANHAQVGSPSIKEMREVRAAVAKAHRLIRGDCPGAAGDVLFGILTSTAAYQVPATNPAPEEART